jgi:hypothetical protein
MLYYERRIIKRERKGVPISQLDVRNGHGAKKDDSIKSAAIFHIYSPNALNLFCKFLSPLEVQWVLYRL